MDNVVKLRANDAIGDRTDIADMLENLAADIRSGGREDLRRIMVITLDGVGVQIRTCGERATSMEGVGMLEYAKSELMYGDH